MLGSSSTRTVGALVLVVIAAVVVMVVLPVPFEGRGIDVSPSGAITVKDKRVPQINTRARRITRQPERKNERGRERERGREEPYVLTHTHAHARTHNTHASHLAVP